MEVEARHIWRQPPTRADLGRIAAALAGGARALLATRSRRYRELGLDASALGEGELLDLLAREPRLLRRPILWDGRHAVVGADRNAIDALISPPAGPPAR